MTERTAMHKRLGCKSDVEGASSGTVKSRQRRQREGDSDGGTPCHRSGRSAGGTSKPYLSWTPQNRDERRMERTQQDRKKNRGGYGASDMDQVWVGSDQRGCTVESGTGLLTLKGTFMQTYPPVFQTSYRGCKQICSLNNNGGLEGLIIATCIALLAVSSSPPTSELERSFFACFGLLIYDFQVESGLKQLFKFAVVVVDPILGLPFVYLPLEIDLQNKVEVEIS
ncbi:hypothetical protein LXL04_016615 [Taraxacum kok-saghyz]